MIKLLAEQREPLKFLPELDGLRGISVLLVLFFHLDRRFSGLEFLYDKMKLGKLGVSLFFLLSGYLITRILLFIPPNFASLKMFWIRRFLRIFPIYYLTVITVFILWPGPYLLSSLVYLVNYTNAYYVMWAPLNHTWSLAVEEHFYLIWPVLFIFFPKKSKKTSIILLLLSIVGGFLTMYFFSKTAGKKLVSEASHVQIFCLCIGAWLAHFRIENIKAIKIISISMIISFTCSMLFINWDELGLHKILYRHLAGSLLAAGIFLYTLASSASPDLWAKILKFKLLQEIGKISYGIYLYHLPIYFIFKVMDDGAPDMAQPYWIAFLAILTVWLLAFLSFRFVETPIIKCKDRFPYPKVR